MKIMKHIDCLSREEALRVQGGKYVDSSIPVIVCWPFPQPTDDTVSVPALGY